MSDGMGWINTELSDFESLLGEGDLEQIPVDLDTFLTDPYYLGGLGVKKISDPQRRIIEQISQVYFEDTLIEIHGEEEGKRIWDDTVHEVVAMCGKGSGKDFSCRIAFAYTVYKLHCLRDPVRYYGKSHGTYIDLLNIAVNADQANNVFFQPLKNILMKSPFFNEVGFEPRKKEITFYEKPIRLFSGNSEAEAWEGLDLLLVVLDEIAAFKTDTQFKGTVTQSQRLSASAIYRMSKASVMSRFPELGKCILISFPRYQGDFITQRYDESALEPNVLRIKAKTFDMNPMITREMLEPEYIRNPVDAKSRFECEPPMMVDAFFRDPDRVKSCFKSAWKVIDEGTDEEKRIQFEVPELNPLNEDGTFKPWFEPGGENHTRFIHVDLGVKRDRAALAMSHSPGMRKIETVGGFETLPVVVMDLVKYWEATPGRDVDFEDIRKTIILLCKKFDVGLVTFDQWQSVDMIQILRRKGINADTYSVGNKDYDNLATCFYDHRFSGYFHKLLVDGELLRLQVMPNGKVDHPDDGTKDLSDALAGSAAHVCSYAEYDNEIEIEVLGLDDDELDWETMETQEAIEEEQAARDGRRKPRADLTTVEEDFEFELEAI